MAHDRSVGHAWARLENSAGVPFILDVAHGYCGTLSDRPLASWDYNLSPQPINPGNYVIVKSNPGSNYAKVARVANNSRKLHSVLLDPRFCGPHKSYVVVTDDERRHVIAWDAQKNAVVVVRGKNKGSHRSIEQSVCYPHPFSFRQGESLIVVDGEKGTLNLGAIRDVFCIERGNVKASLTKGMVNRPELRDTLMAAHDLVLSARRGSRSSMSL